MGTSVATSSSVAVKNFPELSPFRESSRCQALKNQGLRPAQREFPSTVFGKVPKWHSVTQGFRRWLCRNCFSQHDVGFSLQRVVHIEDQVDLPRTPLLDHHRMPQEVTTHRGEVHRLVTLW